MTKGGAVKRAAVASVAVVLLASFLPWQWKIAIQIPAALCATVAVVAWAVILVRAEARKLRESQRRWR